MKKPAMFFALGLMLSTISLSAAGAPDEVVSSLQPYVDRHDIAGAVTLAVSRSKTLSLDAVGYADIAAKRPMRADTLFWIASMSKPIAAVAVMMLVDEHKVKLDEPVDEYLPQFTPRIMTMGADPTHVRLAKPLHPVTLRTLLSHTSGIPAVSSIEAPTLDTLPLDVRVQSYALEPLSFEPGGDVLYSNAGVNTAARVVEVVSGMPYEVYLQKRVFAPLGMNDTTFWPTDAQLARLAKSYKPDDSRGSLEETPISQLHYPLADRAHRYPVPAGGLFSSAADLGRFCQMLLNGGLFGGRRILSEVAIREMTQNQIHLADPQRAAMMRQTLSRDGFDGYGLGWITSSTGAFGHNGAYATQMRIDPARNLATVWLIQYVDVPVDRSRNRDARIAFEQAVEKRFMSARAQ